MHHVKIHMMFVIYVCTQYTSHPHFLQAYKAVSKGKQMEVYVVYESVGKIMFDKCLCVICNNGELLSLQYIAVFIGGCAGVAMKCG